MAIALAALMFAAASAPTLAHAAPASKPIPPPVFTGPSGKVFAGQLALFTATRMTGVTGYTWTLSGPGVAGGTYTAACGPNTSQLESSFSHGGTMSITLTVAYPNGASNRTTHTLTIRGAKVRPIGKAMASQATQWVLCQRAPADPAVRPAGNGGPATGCQDEYFDGNIDAIGCLSMLASYNKIPAAESKLLCPFFGARCATLKTPVVPALLPLLSTKALRLNGVDVAPARGTAFVLDQNDGWLASSSASVSMLQGLLPVHTGQLKVAQYKQPLFSANLTELLARYPLLASALNLSGFQINGTLTVSLSHAVSMVAASVTLPGSFTDSGGHPVTSSVAMTATNQAGLVLDNLLIAVPNVDFGGALEFDNLAFCYQLHISEGFCEKKTGASFGSFEGSSASSWNATGKINILGTQINAVPSPVNPEQGIGFVNGQFDFAGASVAFSPSIPLGSTGVSLSSLQASLALNPTRFQGSVGITAGDLVSINGRLFMVFASPSQPYTFNGHEVGAASMPTPTVHAFAMAVGGTVGVTLPVVGNTTLGSGYVLYAYPAYLAVGGNVGFSILGGALSVNGGVNGQFSLSNAQFDVEGNISIHALFLTMGADVIVSSVGIGACGSIGTPFGPAVAGVGYMWGGSVSASVGSCNLAPYRVIVPSAGRRLHPGYQFAVKAGLPTEMVQVRGLRGAPELTITGPGGIHASIGAGSKAAGRPFLIYKYGHTTYIAILKPKAGVYTITASGGSPAITEVLRADGRSGSPRQRFGVHVR